MYVVIIFSFTACQLHEYFVKKTERIDIYLNWIQPFKDLLINLTFRRQTVRVGVDETTPLPITPFAWQFHDKSPTQVLSENWWGHLNAIWWNTFAWNAIDEQEDLFRIRQFTLCLINETNIDYSFCQLDQFFNFVWDEQKCSNSLWFLKCESFLCKL